MLMSVSIAAGTFANHSGDYYTVAQKMCNFTFVHIFANYWPIFKTFSLAHSADNL